MSIFGLLKERKARVRGDTKFVSLNLPNNFVNYRYILKVNQTWLLVFLSFWLICGFASNNLLAEVFVCVTGIPIALKQYKFFGNLRNFFRYEFEIDYELLAFIEDAELDEGTLIVYSQSNSKLNEEP